MRGSSRTMTAVSVAAVCAAALAIGACGSSSYEGLSKADFITRTDATCKTYDAQLDGLFRHVGSNPSVEEIKAIYADKAMPVFRKELDDLRAIKPPKEDRDEIKTVLDDLSDGIDQVESAVADSTSLDELQKIEPAGLKKANAGAKAYGLKVCGQS